MKLPADREKHGKMLSKTMQRLMYEKYIQGYLKYKTKIEEKPLMGEVLEEILDLSNYFLVLMFQIEEIRRLARTSKNLSQLKKKIEDLFKKT